MWLSSDVSSINVSVKPIKGSIKPLIKSQIGSLADNDLYYSTYVTAYNSYNYSKYQQSVGKGTNQLFPHLMVCDLYFILTITYVILLLVNVFITQRFRFYLLCNFVKSF